MAAWINQRTMDGIPHTRCHVTSKQVDYLVISKKVLYESRFCHSKPDWQIISEMERWDFSDFCNFTRKQEFYCYVLNDKCLFPRSLSGFVLFVLAGAVFTVLNSIKIYLLLFLVLHPIWSYVTLLFV